MSSSRPDEEERQRRQHHQQRQQILSSIVASQQRQRQDRLASIVARVSAFFDTIHELKALRERRAMLQAALEHRVLYDGYQRGDDPEFETHWEQVISRPLYTPFMVLTERCHDSSRQDRILILCDSTDETARTMISEGRVARLVIAEGETITTSDLSPQRQVTSSLPPTVPGPHSTNGGNEDSLISTTQRRSTAGDHRNMPTLVIYCHTFTQAIVYIEESHHWRGGSFRSFTAPSA